MSNEIWRQINSHNNTFKVNNFSIEKCTVGRRTYGGLKLHEFGHPDEKLNIGSFCSIANEVTFLLGGGHKYDLFTTYPLSVHFFGQKHEAITKGEIIVCDDVWIGFNSLLLSGVKVGQGAIIAANSVVSKDVPPYSIVAGNPAKIVKYRFNDKIIQVLTQLDYKKISDHSIIVNRELILKEITLEVAHEILEKLQNI